MAANDVTVTIHGKETVSKAANNAVQGLNKMRSEVSKVTQAAKFMAGGAAGAAVIRYLNDSVKAYRDSEIAAAKLAGTILTGPAASLVHLETAFKDLKVLTGQAFVTAARPVLEWLAQVATDAAWASRELRAAKDALAQMRAGQGVTDASAMVAGLNLELQELNVQLKLAETPQDVARIRELIEATEALIRKERERVVEERNVSAWVARGAAEQKRANEELTNWLKMVEDAYAKTPEARKEALEAAIAFWEGELKKANVTAPKIIAIIADFRRQLDDMLPKTVTQNTEEATTAQKYYNAELGEYELYMQRIIETLDEYDKRQKEMIESSRDNVQAMGEFVSTLAEGFGAAFVEGAAEGIADAFKSEFVRLLQMLATYSWAQVAASLFPLTGLPNPYAAAKWGAAALAASVAAGAINAMAEGGIINEPIIGRGLRTGSTYAMGEAGPELVTPLSGGRAHAAVVNNYYVSGSIWETERLGRVLDRRTRGQVRGY